MANKSFVFRFDGVEVREREFTLIKAGRLLTVEPKAFRALLFLLHNPQKLISKKELLDAVWGDTAVTEGSLTRCIWLLRQLLGDDIHNPRYIETVATVGYRWLCKAEAAEEFAVEGESTGEPKDLSSHEKKDGSKNRMLGWALAGSGASILCLAGAISYLHRPLPPLRVTGYTQITHDGHLKAPSGTDGSRLYFNEILGEAAIKSIAQVAISGGVIEQIPVALPTPVLVDVSPDGSNLLVISVPEGDNYNNPLWNVQTLGGSTRRLGEASDASYSPDGNSVVFAKAKDGIWLVPTDGTAAHKLASVAGDIFRLAWSPDRTTIRFTKDGSIWEMSSGGSNPHDLLSGWHTSSEKCCGRWTADGKVFLFWSDHQIWALDERHGLFRRPPAGPIQLTWGPIHWGRPIPGKDESRIFAAGRIPRGELSRFDAKTKQFLPFLAGISAQGVVFSKDGKSVAYVSYPDGTLWKANRDGSHPVQLTDSPMIAFLPRLSPDGTQIVFAGSSPAIDNGDTSHIYIVSSEGGSPPKLLPEIREQTILSDWSPDGHKIVFNAGSDDQLGQFEKGTYDVRILDLDSHRVTIVPGSTDIWGPRWSPDGRYLVAGSEDEIRLMIFDFKTQKWSGLPQKGLVDSPEWSRDSQLIYFRRPRGDKGVFRIPIKGGNAEKIVDLKDWHDAGWAGKYMGLDPTDAPLLLRDISSDDIYALTLDWK
jgi:Tol biopolymer transport system component/DNA-binding winged helix-turn-helix (wHTH) protein